MGHIVTTIIPIFILVILGTIARSKGFLPPEFLGPANRLVFYLAIPAMIFRAIANASLTRQFNPDGSLMMENRFAEKTIAALKAKGHDVKVVGGYAEIMGSSQVIMIDRENGVLKAGADPRRQAYAIGK